MTAEDIKGLFIKTVREENFKLLGRDHLAILDEAIESILDGKSLIDGKIPQTEKEILICLWYYFETANQVKEAFLKSTFQSDIHLDQVTVNYRGETFVYSKDN